MADDEVLPPLPLLKGPDDPPLTEVVDIHVEFDLVPEWSNVVEKIGGYYGDKVEVGFEGKDLVVKVTIKSSEKERMMYDMGKTWDYFVDTKKREKKWTRPN